MVLGLVRQSSTSMHGFSTIPTLHSPQKLQLTCLFPLDYGTIPVQESKFCFNLSPYTFHHQHFTGGQWVSFTPCSTVFCTCTSLGKKHYYSPASTITKLNQVHKQHQATHCPTAPCKTTSWKLPPEGVPAPYPPFGCHPSNPSTLPAQAVTTLAPRSLPSRQKSLLSPDSKALTAPSQWAVPWLQLPSNAVVVPLPWRVPTQSSRMTSPQLPHHIWHTALPLSILLNISPCLPSHVLDHHQGINIQHLVWVYHPPLTFPPSPQRLPNLHYLWHLIHMWWHQMHDKQHALQKYWLMKRPSKLPDMLLILTKFAARRLALPTWKVA